MRKPAFLFLPLLFVGLACESGGPTAPESTPRYEGYVTSADDGRPLLANVWFRGEAADQPHGGPGALFTWDLTDENGFYQLSTYFGCEADQRYFLVATSNEGKHEVAHRFVECRTSLQRVDIQLLPIPDSAPASP